MGDPLSSDENIYSYKYYQSGVLKYLITAIINYYVLNA